MLTKSDIRKQSEAAYSQWAELWRNNATVNSHHKMNRFSDFENIGIGKAVLCVATGGSLQTQIETIKEHQHNVDIMCCDKSLGILIDNGITPTYVIVCDARVDYEKYMEPWKDKLQDSFLIMNACGNPLWASNGNWKKKYFFVVKDILNSEKEFSAISGCPNIVPAGTNVSNSLVIILTQSDNEVRKNYFGYDKILLIGFDYSWEVDGNYYAYDKTGGGKTNYMRHGVVFQLDGEVAFTSSNLLFSGKWLQQYVTTFGLPVVQCTRNSIVAAARLGKLSEQMDYRYQVDDGPRVRDKIKLRTMLDNQIKEIDKGLASTAIEHHNSYLASTG